MARKPADQSVNREDILLAAAEVLRAKGYESTTMKDIAKQVDLTAASLYHHFKNKDFLLLAVLEEGLQRGVALLQEAADSEKTNTERLRQMIRAHIVNLTDNPAFGAAIVFEIRPLINAKMQQVDVQSQQMFENRRNKFFAMRDSFEALFRQVIVDGIAAGEFREVNASVFAKTMLGAQNWVGVWYRPGGRLTGQDIAEQVADTFLTSLQK